MPDARIGSADTAADIASVVVLFRAYAASLPIDLGYQNFEAELAAMPGKYTPPGGALLLARDGNGAAIGCVGLRKLDEPGGCEMKRLYVAPEARGTGLGRALVEAVVDAATRLGYRVIRLDTLQTMTGAIALYTSVGFVPTTAYYDTPIEGTIFLARVIAPQG